MPIVRVAPLLDARSTGNARTSCGEGTIYDLGGLPVGQKMYSSLHILSSSTTGVGGELLVRIQGSSSSAGGGMTDYVSFTSRTCRSGEWGNPLTTGTLTTERKFWRATWELTTCGEAFSFVPGMGFK